MHTNYGKQMLQSLGNMLWLCGLDSAGSGCSNGEFYGTVTKFLSQIPELVGMLFICSLLLSVLVSYFDWLLRFIGWNFIR